MLRSIDRLALVFIAAIIIVLIAIGSVRGAPQGGVVGTGTALSCDEAALAAKLAGGGLITFNCGAAPVTITLSSEVLITSTTIISGNSLITLSGNDVTRLFNVGSGVTFSLVNLKITHGYASFDSGGAIVSQNGNSTVVITNTTFTFNIAGNFGGAIQSYGTLIARDAKFFNNTAGLNGGSIDSTGLMTVMNSTFSTNTAGIRGGAINNYLGTVTVIGSQLISNTSHGYGGGLVNDAGIATIINSNFFSNTANNVGGGIRNSGLITIENSIFALNYAVNSSGAIENSSTSTTTIQNSSFFSNSSQIGGVSLNSGVMTVTRSMFSGNFAIFVGGFTGKGGAIRNSGWLGILTSTFTLNKGIEGGAVVNLGRGKIVASTFYNNGVSTGYGNGGAIFTYNDLDIINSTLSGNVGYYGGGLFWFNGQVNIINSTIVSNSAGHPGANIMVSPTYYLVSAKNTIIAYGNPTNCDGALKTFDYNLENTNTCGFTSTHDLNNTDPHLGLLQDNGGSILTYVPLSNSLAIDGGTNTGCPSTDQRGVTRPFDGDGNGSALCDIGAVEFKIYKIFLPLVLK